LNAARHARDEACFLPRRDQSYLGVLIDDLTTHGTNEPYRMFTSRAEYRLHLREDNADVRLTELGREFGLVDETRYQAFARKQERIEVERARLHALVATPNNPLGQVLGEALGQPLSREVRALDALKRPELNYATLTALAGFGPALDDKSAAEQIEIAVKYAGYLDRQRAEVEKQKAQDERAIPVDFDYERVRGLSAEVLQKLKNVRPLTLGQAARIAGVTPAAVSLLAVYLHRAGLNRVA
jgi:tRNA uridine 5-carboxymethylaminomethyl modification enzyme